MFAYYKKQFVTNQVIVAKSCSFHLYSSQLFQSDGGISKKYSKNDEYYKPQN